MDVLTKGLEITEKARNYNCWLFEVIKPYLGKRVLEIGSGLGTFTKMFSAKNFVIASEVDTQYLGMLKEKFKNKKNVLVTKMDAQKISQLKAMKNKNIDTIVAINVLEHIKDDLGALENFYSVLPPGGKIILFVPAFPVLLGEWDRKIGHFRRYTKNDLESKIKSCGFSPVKSSYFNSLGFLSWWFNKVIKKTPADNIVVIQARIFDRYVVPLLAAIEKFLKPPVGQSLIVIGEKN